MDGFQIKLSKQSPSRRMAHVRTRTLDLSIQKSLSVSSLKDNAQNQILIKLGVVTTLAASDRRFIACRRAGTALVAYFILARSEYPDPTSAGLRTMSLVLIPP